MAKKRQSEDMDYKRLKEVITNIVVEQPQEELEEEEVKELKNDHMFVLDDRDRFG